MSWHDEHWISVDTETTGTNAFEDRIVTAAVVHLKPGHRPRSLTWVIDPGVPIPDEAAQVHGWTTERIANHRDHRGPAMQPDQALFEIAGQVALAITQGVPVIVFNAAYDLSIIEAECARHDVPTLTSRVGPKGIRGVVDPIVLEKQYDPYRKTCYKAPGCRPEDQHHECGGCQGSKKTRCGGCGTTDKKLTSLCAHYGVRHTGAHDAGADALATARLLRQLVARDPGLARMTLTKLFQAQVGWRQAQMDSLRSFFDKAGKEHDGCCGEFPVHAACVRQAVAS